MQQPARTTMDKDMPDAELARRIAGGDQQAFEILMRRYNRVLYRTARSVLKDDAEAEDVLQDAYLLAYRRIEQFRGDARLSTWLTRIVVNEAIARSRKRSRRAQIISLDGDIEWDSEAAEASMSESTPEQPERAALRGEARRLLEKKIDELPDAFRTVFMLRALEELSVEETASCLGIPEATVRTRFFRARGLLRESLSREIDFAFEEAFSFDGARCDRIVNGVLARLGDAPRDDA
ncbi:MAG TPA: RNA polymerase sigma factor [Noviherbaspirillum sp.]|uniref:RNA polymerase sigma factor n=1 Tax=Noviherbaspirillum sp. TaxID=1926288 RepID=UPI002B490A61|nr:RNA polymerase sigma factor [Noviherbaspirillum sp.]HJV86191.1 RNA polymerase sigma factor [Noviherbaspirillum sp.]